MPFHGVLAERRHLFQPEPKADVGVNDHEAWRLNPAHRHLYNKLELALWQGLEAAACNVPPTSRGVAADQAVFVKPITNLAGMSLNARAMPAGEVHDEPGCFWCTHLSGVQTSSDCLVHQGNPVWFAHTRAAQEKHRQRPVYWEVGVELAENERLIGQLLQQHLSRYTGLLNVEVIDGYIIEVHLRGSNAFFDFYGEAFIPAWSRMMDRKPFEPPPKIPGGVVYSVFVDEPVAPEWQQEWQQGWQQEWPFPMVQVQPDRVTPDRLCILRGKNLQTVGEAAEWIHNKIICH